MIKGVINHGPCAIKKIKKESFGSWTETEIKLRICRLLKYYNLKDYEGRMFVSEEEILEEARKNKQDAQKQKLLVGGILYNPQPENEENMFTNASTSSKSKTKKP